MQITLFGLVGALKVERTIPRRATQFGQCDGAAGLEYLGGDGILTGVDPLLLVAAFEIVLEQQQVHQPIDPVVQGVEARQHAFQEEEHEVCVGGRGALSAALRQVLKRVK